MKTLKTKIILAIILISWLGCTTDKPNVKVYHAQQFGLVGDGVTDNSEAFRDLLDATSGQICAIEFESGTSYSFSNNIFVYNRHYKIDTLILRSMEDLINSRINLQNNTLVILDSTINETTWIIGTANNPPLFGYDIRDSLEIKQYIFDIKVRD